MLVVFVVIVAFVAVAAAMQVLILTSVATTSRAYDSYRQGAMEMQRLERAVAEALLEQRQASVAATPHSLAESLNAEIAILAGDGATVRAVTVPTALPAIKSFPDALSPPDPLYTPAADVVAFMTPELAWLSGPRVASYPEVRFEFSSERAVLEANRIYRTEVRARFVAVPLTRFAQVSYELPSAIGRSAGGAPSTTGALTQGLVPSRDAAFVPDLQAEPGVLPYHYRRRAVLSAAYQYIFSQPFIDRCVNYAGLAHFHQLDASMGTAVLKGMSSAGTVTTWDLADAGPGTCGATTDTRDVAVVFTETGGATLRLQDSSAEPDRPPFFLLVLGPADVTAGPLAVDLGSIARPVVIIGYNVRVSAAAGAVLHGALLLDPASSFADGTTLTAGHVSYWAGCPIGRVTLAAGSMPAAAEAIAPRVVYVATQAARL